MPRRRLDLHISGLNEDDLRRWPSHTPHNPGRALLVKLILFTVLCWVAPKLVPESSVEQGGKIVRGNRILLIQDTSGSMKGYQATVDQRLATLRAAGMYSDVACRLLDNEFPDFVDCVEGQARREDIDGLYVFADFRWGWTPEGLRRVTQALEPTGWRLYLETIGIDPAPELMRLVEPSGGAMIRTPK